MSSLRVVLTDWIVTAIAPLSSLFDLSPMLSALKPAEFLRPQLTARSSMEISFHMM
jgi:hypothetical protein